MKTIYIHIGTEKTGTKSIQRFCSKHGDFLKEKGIYYPTNSDKKYVHGVTHWPMAAALSKRNIFVPINKRAPTEEIYKEFLDDIKSVQYNNILISAEPFSVNVASKESIEKLKELLNEYNVKIIVYIRRQDKYFISHTSTRVKDGTPIPTIDVLIDEVLENQNRYNYERLLDKWASTFGKENLIVRRFGSDYLKDHNIISDFFKLFNIDVSDKLELSSKENVSLSLDALHFLGLVNVNLELNKEERAKIYSMLEKRPSHFDIKQLLTYEQRNKILKHYQKSNQAVAIKYMNLQGEVLFEKIDAQEQISKPFTNLAPAATFDICKFLLRHKYGNKMPSKINELLIRNVVQDILDK